MYSNPASSAVRATAASSAPSRSGPRGVLKSGICKPIFIVNDLPPSNLSPPDRPHPRPHQAHPARPAEPEPQGLGIVARRRWISPCLVGLFTRLGQGPEP